MMYALFVSLISQNLFAKAFGGSDKTYTCSDITTTLDNSGYLLVGKEDMDSTWQGVKTDFLVMKMRPDGSLDWARTYGDSLYHDAAVSVLKASDNSYVVVGWTGLGGGASDLMAIKLAPDGSLQWARTYGERYADLPVSAVETPDNGYLIAAYTHIQSGQPEDILLVKTTQDGIMQWAKIYGGPREDRPTRIIETSDSGFVIVGVTYELDTLDGDILLFKINPDGSLQWAKIYQGSGYEGAGDIIQTSDSGFIFAGSSNSYSASDDALVMRLNADGSLRWAKIYGDARDNAASVVFELPGTQGFVVAGGNYAYGAGNHEFLAMRMDTGGSVEWFREFGTPGDELLYSSIRAVDGGIIMGGIIDTSNTAVYDVLVLEMGLDGSYPGCVSELSMNEQNVLPDVFSYALQSSDVQLDTMSPTLRVTMQELDTLDLCSPLETREEPRDPSDLRRITCVPGAGFVLFMSQERAGITVYRADGGLAYRGLLKKGKNPVALERGVYFWQSGQQSGKAVVR